MGDARGSGLEEVKPLIAPGFKKFSSQKREFESTV
jgi:hypothetical protein